jgi:O-Antigen ligase
MSATAVRRLLFVASVLIVWGPPALRSAGRDLDSALANPFALDPAAFLQVGAWVFAFALAGLLLLAHLARGTGFLSDLLSNRPAVWYGLYGMLGLASMTWSSSPVYTMFFAHKILVGILLLALLEWHWPARAGGSRALQVLFVVYTLQAAAIAILYFVDRRWVVPFGTGGGPESVRVTGGVFGDYGSSGLLAGLFFLTVVLFDRRTKLRLLAGAAYLGTWWLMVVSQTRSTMAAGVVFLVVMVLAHPRARTYGPLIAAGAGVAAAGLMPALLRGVVSVGTREGQGIDTLSGRTDAFSYLMERWQSSPLLGYGFAAGTRDALIGFVASRGLNIGAGHDALSTVLVDLGLAGLSLLLAAFIAAWLAWIRLHRAAIGQRARISTNQILCLLVWVTIQTVVSRSLASPYLIFVVAVIALGSVQKWRMPAMPAASLQRQGDGRRA